MDIDLDGLEQRMLREYTERRSCVVDGWPDAHTAWLSVGGQQFCVTPLACETAEEADWARAMLAKALASVVVRKPEQDLCAVCGRPPHICDDPECVPPTKSTYQRLIHCLAENGFLRADRNDFAEAFYLLWLSSDRGEWDGKAVEHFDALMDKSRAYEAEKNKTPNELGHRPETAGGRNGSGGPTGSASGGTE